MFEKGTSVPRYLIFLNVVGSDDEVGEALSCLRRGLVRSDVTGELTALWRERNWRAHLVAALALLCIDDVPEQLIDEVWAAFDDGSWVTPQLAVVAHASPSGPSCAWIAPAPRRSRRCTTSSDATPRSQAIWIEAATSPRAGPGVSA